MDFTDNLTITDSGATNNPDSDSANPYADLNCCKRELEQLGKLCSEGLHSNDPRVSFLALVVAIHHCVGIFNSNEGGKN